MKQVIAWALVGFIAALLPARFWIVVGLAAAALVFALGIWATAMMMRGFLRGMRERNYDAN